MRKPSMASSRPKRKHTPSVLKKPSGSNSRRCRIAQLQPLASLLESEAQERIDKVNSEEDVALQCPLCGVVARKRCELKRHAAVHSSGKKVALHGNMAVGKRERHPVVMAIVRSLYDEDQLKGTEGGQYVTRAVKHLSQWLFHGCQPSEEGYVWRALGHRDGNVTLVLTGDGPQYWRSCDPRLQGARKAGCHHYTVDFANRFASQLLSTGGQVMPAAKALWYELRSEGCDLTTLGARNKSFMFNVALDIMESDVFKSLQEACAGRLHRLKSLKCLSVDATYKLSLKVPSVTRNQKKNFVTVTSLHGAMVGSEDCVGEGALSLRTALQRCIQQMYRADVLYMSFDTTSPKLLKTMKDAFPNLEAISLDSLHLCYNTDLKGTKRRFQTGYGNRVLRSIMNKFNFPCPQRTEDTFYAGGTVSVPPRELKLVAHATNRDMPRRTARAVLETMDPSAAIRDRQDVVELIAAFIVMYPATWTSRQIRATRCMPFCSMRVIRSESSGT